MSMMYSQDTRGQQIKNPRKPKNNASDSKNLKKKDDDEDKDDKKSTSKRIGGSAKAIKLTTSTSSTNQKSTSSKAADSQKDGINLADDTDKSERASDNEDEQKSGESNAVTDNNSKNHKSKYDRNYSNADDVPIKPNLMIDTTVSFEHIVEMTIPNSIYSEQGKKIHKR